MSRLALGTAQFGLTYGIANQTGQVGIEAGQRMLALTASAGIDLIDTAIAYGDSETRLGLAGVTNLRVVTKLPPLPKAVPDAFAWSHDNLLASLSRLRVPRVYGLLLHQPADLMGPQGLALLDALRQAKDDGLVEKIGVSIYTPQELPVLMALHPFDLVQSPLNLIDRRLVTTGWLDRLADAGVEVHTRSAFLQGLLLMPLAEQQRRFPAWSYLWSRWHNWLQAVGGNAVGHCLSWALEHTSVARVIVGADTSEQLQAIVDAASFASNAAGWPPISCEDEGLVNPALWSRS